MSFIWPTCTGSDLGQLKTGLINISRHTVVTCKESMSVIVDDFYYKIPSHTMHRSMHKKVFRIRIPKFFGSVSQRYGSGFGSRSGSFHHQAKIVRNIVNVPSKINKQKNRRKFLGGHLEGHWRKEQDPDLYIRGTDLRIRIRAKISRIRNTVKKIGFWYAQITSIVILLCQDSLESSIFTEPRSLCSGILWRPRGYDTYSQTQ